MGDRSAALEVTRVSRANWKIGSADPLYALAIVDTRIGGIGGASATEVVKSQFSTDTRSALTTEPEEFVFRMNPKQMRLEEPAAVQIIPTQGGGQFIEHQGQIYKNITISGTTGLRPNPKISASFFPLTNLKLPFGGPDTDPITGLPVGERTGFDDLIDLRNLFRKYWSYKVDGTRAPYTVMVWQNGKEGELYIVEPMNFSTERSSASPYTFNYNIALRTIERFDLRRRIPRDSVTNLNGKAGFFERVKVAQQKLRQNFVILQSIDDAALLAGRRLTSRLFDPVSTVIDGLAGVINTGNQTLPVGRQFVNDIKIEALNLVESLNGLRTATDSFLNSGILSRQATAANQAKNMVWVTARIAAEDQLFSEKLSNRVTRRQGAYRDPVTGNPRTGGDPTNLTNAPIPTGTKKSVIQSGETIRTCARRLLGSTNLWRQLVIINDLRAPYISPAGDGISVLRPNDTILYPTSSETAPENSVANDVAPKTIQKDDLTNRLGRDVLIKSDPALAGIDKFDFAINSRGDIALIEGVDNLEQAVLIKFSTEQGQLPVHFFFGIRAPIGEKIRVRSLIQFQANARASLLSDTRIADVIRFDARAEGNVLLISTSLSIRGADSGISTSFGVRR